MSDPPSQRETPKPERSRRDFFRTLVGRGENRPAVLPADVPDRPPEPPPPDPAPKSRRNPRPGAVPSVRK